MGLAATRHCDRARAWLWHALCRLDAGLARTARALVVALAAVMVAAIVWQVLTRGLLGRSPPWTEEVALLAFGWIVLLMTAIGVREHLHVRLDTLVLALPARARRLAEAAICLLVAAIGGYLVWAGWGYLVEMRGSTSQAIKYPTELLYAAVPVSCALMALFALENAIRGRPAEAGAPQSP